MLIQVVNCLEILNSVAFLCYDLMPDIWNSALLLEVDSEIQSNVLCVCVISTDQGHTVEALQQDEAARKSHSRSSSASE